MALLRAQIGKLLDAFEGVTNRAQKLVKLQPHLHANLISKSRHPTTRRFGLALVSFAVLLFAPLIAVANAPRPNIVVFISDDHGHLDSSIAGAPEFRTPNLERISNAGIRCTHAFAASPSCAPSRAALLTGLMPMRSGSMLNHQPPRAHVKKLPAYLQELGYEVVAFGKVAHYKQTKDYGFDHFDHDTFHDHQCIPAALQFLNNRKNDKPLCLLVGTNWPHVPWPNAEETADPGSFRPPPTHVDTPETRKWRARYAAAVERFDRDLGRIYDAAYAKLGDNTLFIHFSDHGAQWPFAKWNLYDAGTRVDFCAVWPGHIKPRGRSDAFISLVDVLPTLIEAAGGNPPEEIDGRSLLDLLTGKTASHRESIFTTHSGDGRMNAFPMRSIRTKRWKYIRNLDPDAKHTTHIDNGEVVDGNEYWRSWVEAAENDPQAARIVKRYHHRPAEELYDVRTDPHEQRTVASIPANGKALIQLRQQLDRWMTKQGDAGMATEKDEAAAFQADRTK